MNNEVVNMVYPMLLEVTKVSFPGLGIHDLPIDRVAFSIGSFSIYWYSICIILAFIACVSLAMFQAKKYGMTSEDVMDYALVCIPSAMVGARVYYVASSWKNYASDPMSVFDIRNGGLAVLGGVLFALIAGVIVTKFKKKDLSLAFGFLIVYIPLGQAIGRWGNFFNQEAFGTNTKLPWGMISSETTYYLSTNVPTLDANAPVHPTFLYESLATLVIFLILLVVRKKCKISIMPIAMYFILYGTARFFIEGLRTDSLYIGNTDLRTSQVLSAILVVAGFAMIAISRYLSSNRTIQAASEDPVPDTVTEDK
jgi:phosphatidylglycerol:prolipoprotein diacylglycerol transferase